MKESQTDGKPASGENKAEWPRSYKMQTSLLPGVQWWSYSLYRGPDNKKVEVLYSKNKTLSEQFVQRFLGETVVGFDMEVNSPKAAY